MFNERAVCQAIIDSACEMHWPHNRCMIQVVTSHRLSSKPCFHQACKEATATQGLPATLHKHRAMPTSMRQCNITCSMQARQQATMQELYSIVQLMPVHNAV